MQQRMPVAPHHNHYVGDRGGAESFSLEPCKRIVSDRGASRKSHDQEHQVLRDPGEQGDFHLSPASLNGYTTSFSGPRSAEGSIDYTILLVPGRESGSGAIPRGGT